MRHELLEIIARRALNALFQPIVDMADGQITGYEGLIRGPSDSLLHAPLALFQAARQYHLEQEVEQLCREITVENFVKRKLPGKLFMNVSPECLLAKPFGERDSLDFIQRSGLKPSQIIIELTEHQPTHDYPMLREAARHYRSMGFEIAIDDVGEGFSSLRLWSELLPDYAKIDMHFIQGINQDPVKLQFVKSLQQIAEKSGCRVIAEGIEMRSELMVIKDIGIAFGQGYHIARPNQTPPLALPEISQALSQAETSVYIPANGAPFKTVSAEKLLTAIPPVAPDTPHDVVYEMFTGTPAWQAIAVVNDGVPVGLINRNTLIDRFARPYRRELMSRKPCAKSMNPSPLIIDKRMTLQELSQRILDAGSQHLSDGFIITDQGFYAGMGTGHDLMRELTQMQIAAARYANPLTLLPGNVPINEQVNRLLENNLPFCACYCDINHFKPFNDVYGYRKGDDMIQLTARILGEICEPELDFVGHLGGDDFICLLQSPDWFARCERILHRFKEESTSLFSDEHRQNGGYFSEDRQGNKVLHPLSSLAIGVVPAPSGIYHSHQEIASAMSEAKKQAKRLPPNSLFVERRNTPEKFTTYQHI